MGDYPSRPSRPLRKEIDDRVNDLLVWTIENLAKGWKIQLTVVGGDGESEGGGLGSGDGEASITLFDQEGREVSGDWGSDSLPVWDMVDRSRNPNGDD